MTRTAMMVLFALVVMTGAVRGQEKLTLASPTSQPSIAEYQVDYIGISRGAWSIMVELKPDAAGASRIQCSWQLVTLACSNGYTATGKPVGFASAQAMIVALNKANLSSNSLEKRVYNQLITDGAFTGSVTGSPQ